MGNVDPAYFYSTVKDYCSANGFKFQAPNNAINGDLCAYIKDAPAPDLWACPAGDDECWTEAKLCVGAPPSMAGSDQLSCQLDGVGKPWCCDKNWEKCSKQNGTCWALFDNPLRDVQPSIAAEIASSAIAAKSTGTMSTVPTTTAKQLSTTVSTEAGSIVSTISAHASSVITSTPAGGSGSSTISSDLAGTTSVNSEPRLSSTNLSRGAIAGISVAAIAVLAIFAVLTLWMNKRRKSSSPIMVKLPLEDDEASLHRSPMQRGVGVGNESSPIMEKLPSEDGEVSLCSPMRTSFSAVSSPAMSIISPVESEDMMSPATIGATSEVIVSPMEDLIVLSALQPSPLQTLMLHGRYPNHD